MTLTLLTDISQLALPHLKEGESRTPVDIIEDAAILIKNDEVLARGPRMDVEAQAPAETSRVSCGGRAVIPGLVDSHTHAVFAGQRVDEFLRRGRGESYEEIAAAGGGIRNTAKAFVEGDLEEVVRASTARINRMFELGTTTLEVKTGYGLSVDAELKHFEAIERTAAIVKPRLLKTLLAHVPPKTQSSTQYLEELSKAFSSHLGGLDFIDIFVESTAFTPDDARYFRDLIPRDIALKLHVDQLHDGDGAALASELRALSADHLEFTSEKGMTALRQGDVIGSILPGCGLFLHGSKWPDAEKMRECGVQVAVATDLNPGSSHIENLWVCAVAASTQCGLSLEESFWGITRGGALALGRPDLGCIEPGARSDLLIMDSDHWASGLYSPLAPPVYKIWSQGQLTEIR